MEIPQGLKSREPGTSKGQQEQVLYGQATGKENRKKEQGQAIGQATRISPTLQHIFFLRQAY
jgi:hypothetical protein